MTKLKLKTETGDFAKIHLQKEVNMDIEACQNDVSESFDHCVKSKMLDKLDSDLQCTPITLKHLGLMPNDCETEAKGSILYQNIKPKSFS